MLLQLPQELIIDIVVLLKYRYIKSFLCISHGANKFTDVIIKTKQRLTKGFPRLDGHYHYYKIPSSVIYLNKMNDFDCNYEELHRCMTLVTDKSDIQLDLVRGDVVEFSPQYIYQPYQAIYNGNTLEEMDDLTDGEGLLPDEYQVLEDDVPLTYWNNIMNINIDHIYNQVKDQCLENIVFGKIDDKYVEKWYTTFIYEHQCYKLFLGFNLNKQDFINILTCDPEERCFYHSNRFDKPNIFYVR
ncbi:MAG TPA: hypothetical protein VLG50_07515 [Candidatus Saccharimonadales bacterium]|nr:hypothetical protein [Candidatus Saccharimonadales bacterium]